MGKTKPEPTIENVREKVKEKVKKVLFENYDQDSADAIFKFINFIICESATLSPDSVVTEESKEIVRKSDEIITKEFNNLDTATKMAETLMTSLIFEMYTLIKQDILYCLNAYGLNATKGPMSVFLQQYLISFMKIIILLSKEGLLDQRIFDNSEKIKMQNEFSQKLLSQFQEMFTGSLEKSTPSDNKNLEWWKQLKEIPPEWKS